MILTADRSQAHIPGSWSLKHGGGVGAGGRGMYAKLTCSNRDTFPVVRVQENVVLTAEKSKESEKLECQWNGEFWDDFSKLVLGTKGRRLAYGAFASPLRSPATDQTSPT